jgi:hypothetical protein
LHGEFIVLFDRPDGTVVVSEDLRTVHLVLGIDKTIGYAANYHMIDEQWVRADVSSRNLHGVVGTLCTLTLLPWDNKIIYDTTLRHRARCTEKVLKKAYEAYCKAVDEGTLQTTLVKVSPPKHNALSEGDLHRLQGEFYKDIQLMRVLDGNKEIWKCSRKKMDGIDSIVMSSNKGTTLGSFAVATEPSLCDYMALLRQLTALHGLPSAVHIDNTTMVNKLTYLLQGVVQVVYFVPPSSEEMDIMRALVGADKPRCSYCTIDACEHGKQLFRCTSCHAVHYCTRDHQRLAWKHHKKVCKKEKMLL